jgi:putative addiction module killer protein
MLNIKRTEEFLAWLGKIKDGLTRRRLARRLEKAQTGHLGDTKSVGSGVFEMREHFGPGLEDVLYSAWSSIDYHARRWQ